LYLLFFTPKFSSFNFYKVEAGLAISNWKLNNTTEISRIALPTYHFS